MKGRAFSWQGQWSQHLRHVYGSKKQVLCGIAPRVKGSISFMFVRVSLRTDRRGGILRHLRLSMLNSMQDVFTDECVMYSRTKHLRDSTRSAQFCCRVSRSHRCG